MTISEYKVFIPSAGMGTRLGDLSKNINKALVPVGHKPGISHIIDKFPVNVEIVVALGHLGELIRQYLDQAYPERKITYVQIERYQGPGSGLGRTLLECKEHLLCPFIFCSNDTIVEEDIPPPTENWIGYAKVNPNQQYRTLVINTNQVCSIHEKRDLAATDCAYIGLSGIHDYERFWYFMEKGVNKGSIETGEAWGLRRIVSSPGNVGAIPFVWHDTGSISKLKAARERFSSPEDPNILPKVDEDIWFVNGKVIKYSRDEQFIVDRCQRSKDLAGFVPKIISKSKNMYSYNEVRGNTLARVLNAPIFDNFLNFINELWKPVLVESTDQFDLICDQFYRQKTYDRVNQYFMRFGQKDEPEEVNGVQLPTLNSLLERVDWDSLSHGIPVRFHGDLHFENILVSEDYQFVLLDWRQNFGGTQKYGDLYYDLAKLYHGIIVSHELINKDQYSINADGGVITYDFLRSHRSVEAEKQFKSFVSNKGYDWKKVQVLTALIYLNIASLHHYPYAELLFYLGKSMLAGVL